MNKERLLAQAREELTTRPFDEAHGLSHHQAVWENCQLIIEAEHLRDGVDMDALEIAAMWHDVQRSEDQSGEHC